ncbi:hypothetical protein CEUSTIGMA_g889.t1 [Chlamydomonas eustigma]|uniref:DNA recombination and repair protein Rad51-like C-terminal domain-containing protein n=1 Tax=Chlamydomonas eustigma TaxID=1157962 RepID=A0A250WRG2_9CHLO|nr:hypothetical protein CEUSTIGMA_g889.t1 [Chlamydomonas eustigma]|eukprot:GAX73437.1 hypothetical protein CEUSTIGMA_g889.t1 [Chlamydomonas eustigma]
MAGNNSSRTSLLRPEVILEICGGHGAGKTELLITVAVHFLVYGGSGPQISALNKAAIWQHPSELSDSKGGEVYFIDLDGKFDMVRMIKVLKSHIERYHQDQQPEAELVKRQEHMLQDCLARFTLFTCHSTLEVLTVLIAMQRLLGRQKDSGQPFAGRTDSVGARMLLLDNVAAFYYQDRATRLGNKRISIIGPGEDKLDDPATCGTLTLQRLHASLSTLLSQVCIDHRMACICTKFIPSSSNITTASSITVESAQSTDSHASEAITMKEFMMLSWQSVVTHRIVLSPCHLSLMHGTTLHQGFIIRLYPQKRGIHTGLDHDVSSENSYQCCVEIGNTGVRNFILERGDVAL